jgi:hypothetical protein
MKYLVKLNEKKIFINNFKELEKFQKNLNKNDNFKIIKIVKNPNFNDIEKDEIVYCITELRYIPSKPILLEAIKLDSSIIMYLSYYGIEVLE